MPKDVVLRPNLRVDIPDLEAKTSEFSRELNKLHWERFLLDNRAAIAEGFRVEIADQGSFPGLFTIVNGAGVARDGQITNNQEDITASRSQTIIADATYYIEVEYTTVESAADARAFWDQTFNNGSDPSGDIRPLGREFSRSVATRLTPDWQIVSPISTSGFEYVSNPDSLKIPIATITISGGVIAGATTSPLRSSVAADVPLSATSLELFNTRAMGDTFTLTLNPGGANQEDVSVTANDRENNVLTLGGATTFAHTAGEPVQVGGVSPAEFLVERTDAAIPTSGTEDARPRLFQADELRGEAMASDPAGGASGRSDIQISNLKRYIDYLAGQIAELKFGSARNPGNTAPPTSFSASPRYYEQSGGLVGARSNTVTVGDGVNTFGDFNSIQSGSANAAIEAAIDAVPAGGVVYVKAGTYVLTTAITVNKTVRIIGDPDNTIIRTTGTNELFSIQSECTLEDVVLDVTGTAPRTLTATASITAHRCSFDGAKIASNSSFYDCSFIAPNTGSGTFAIEADSTLEHTTFHSCFLQSLADGGGNRVALFGTVRSLQFIDCTFDGPKDNTHVVEIAGGDSEGVSVLGGEAILSLGGEIFTSVFGFTGTSITKLAILSFNNEVTTGGVSNENLGEQGLQGPVTVSEALRLRDDTSKYAGFKAPSAIASAGAGYELTVPDDLPASDSIIQVSPAGNMTYQDANVDRYSAKRRIVPITIYGTPTSGATVGNWVVNSSGSPGSTYLQPAADGTELHINLPLEDGERLLEVRATVIDNSGGSGTQISLEVIQQRMHNFLFASPPNETVPGTLTSLGTDNTNPEKLAPLEFSWLTVSGSPLAEVDAEDFMYTAVISVFGSSYSNIRFYNLSVVVERL